MKSCFISKCKFPAALSEIYRQPIWEVNLEVKRTRIKGTFGSASFLRRGYETRYPVIVIFSSRISGKSIVLILMEDLVYVLMSTSSSRISSTRLVLILTEDLDYVLIIRR